MTIKEVKESIPDVKISVNGKIYNGKVIGKLVDFPYVYIPELNAEYPFSWEAITRTINEASALKA